MVKIEATLTVYCASIFDDEAGFTVDELLEETNNVVTGVEVSQLRPCNENDEHSDREFTVTGDEVAVRNWIGHFYSVTDQGVQEILEDGTWSYKEI
jgi:hypothetical protein